LTRDPAGTLRADSLAGTSMTRGTIPAVNRKSGAVAPEQEPEVFRRIGH
jgi:hypothetical protein